MIPKLSTAAAACNSDKKQSSINVTGDGAAALCGARVRMADSGKSSVFGECCLHVRYSS